MKEEGISYLKILGITAAKFYTYLQSKETNVGACTHTHTYLSLRLININTIYDNTLKNIVVVYAFLNEMQ